MSFDNIRQALVEYDAGKAAREAMFEAIACNSDTHRWEATEKLALDKVRVAFYKDTEGVNNLANCMLVGEGFMRKCANDFEGITNQESEEFNLYLKACTDAQVLGVLAKEIDAGRKPYALLAESEARCRRLIVGSPYRAAYPL